MHFLIVDDAEHVRASLRAVLELETGWRVVGATPDTAAASLLASELQPDVVLLDAHLPGVDVMRVGRQLMQRSAVVLLTVHDNPALRGEAAANGFALCLPKSAGVAALLEALRAAFARPLAVAHP
jgi:two-component system nitrate/nitrite response regulator NarL